VVKRGSIDLKAGLDPISPQKVKRGSVDLSIGLLSSDYTENSNTHKSALPASIVKHGLERQVSNEESHNGEEIALSPEQVLALLPDVESSNEAWEIKVDTERKR
jgi:hypothetical protein